MKLTKGGQFMKAEGVDKGATVVFKDAGEIQTSDKYTYEDGSPRKNLVFTVEYKGEDKKLRLNNASKINLIEAWGEETKDWIGKSAVIHILPAPNGINKMIILESVNGKPKQEVQW